MKIIARAFDVLIDGLFSFGCYLVLFSFLVVVGDVTLRFFFNYPIQWAVEFTEYALMTVTFLGSAWVLKKEGHVNIDVVLVMMSKKTAAAFTTITSIIAGAVCLSITYYAIELTIQRYEMGSRMVGQALEIPQAPLIAILPLGIFLFALEFFRRAYTNMKLWREKEETIPEVSKGKTEEFEGF